MATLPNNEECTRVISLLADEPQLSSWERDFIKGNLDSTYFSTLQKNVIAQLKEKYECS